MILKWLPMGLFCFAVGLSLGGVFAMTKENYLPASCVLLLACFFLLLILAMRALTD